MAATIEEVTSFSFFSKYRTMLQEAIDHMAEYEERANIHMRLDIPRNHYYNVINEYRMNAAKNPKKEHPYHIPLEYITKAIIGIPDTCDEKYKMAKTWCNDIGGTFLSPREKEEIRSLLSESAPDPIRVLNIMQKLVE